MKPVRFPHGSIKRLQAMLAGKSFRRARQGLAGLEFALLAPVLVSMLAGLYDLTSAYISWERVNLCAQSIDQIATSVAAGNSQTNTLTLVQAQTAASAAYAYLPGILGASPPAFGVTISSVVMTPTVAGCTTGCIYTAHVAWSGVYQGSGTKRPCDATLGTAAITQTADTASPSPTTLPADVYSAASLLVVDVTYTFQPVFYRYLTSNFTMLQSAYFPPRSGLTDSWIEYFPGTSDSTTLCSGYPAA